MRFALAVGALLLTITSDTEAGNPVYVDVNASGPVWGHQWCPSDIARHPSPVPFSKVGNVRFTLESGHKWLGRGMSAFDPKRT